MVGERGKNTFLPFRGMELPFAARFPSSPLPPLGNSVVIMCSFSFLLLSWPPLTELPTVSQNHMPHFPAKHAFTAFAYQIVHEKLCCVCQFSFKFVEGGFGCRICQLAALAADAERCYFPCKSQRKERGEGRKEGRKEQKCLRGHFSNPAPSSTTE